MYDSVEQWRAASGQEMTEYVALRRLIEMLEAEAAMKLAQVIDSYAWPGELPEPEVMDEFRAEQIGDRAYAEDLTSELAIVHKTSTGAAFYMVEEVADLACWKPLCWQKVADGEAPLWQARRIAGACRGLALPAWSLVDQQVAPVLGAVGPIRLIRATEAAIALADPEFLTRRANQNSYRHVHTGADKCDPLTGWVSARVDRADAMSFESMV